MSNDIVLFDLPCKGRCACFSANTWKSRMVLNYKKIPYKTEWITHMEIAPKFKELGIPPGNSSRFSQYSVPTILLPDGTPIMDSVAIAEKLESLHPEPSLHLETNLHKQVEPIIGKAVVPLTPIFMPRVAREKILDSSVPFFRESRRKAFGMELEELEKEKGGEKAWAAARPGLEELSKFIVEHRRDEGPYVLGSQVSYVDFMVVSLLEGLRRVGQDIYDGMVAMDEDGNLAKLHQACQQWMEDDQ